MRGAPGWRPLALAVALVALLRAVSFSNADFAIDDAWISFRVARTFVTTGALTYNPGEPPVEGMTNLAWTLVWVPWVAALPGIDPEPAARVVGLLLHLLTAVLVTRAAWRLAEGPGGHPHRAALVAGGVTALSGSLAFHAMSGLETAMFGALFAWSVLPLLDESATPRAALAHGLALGLLGWTRPEGVLVGGLVVGALAVLEGPRDRLRRVAVPWALALVALEGFRLAYYHQWVPNTFAAKPPDPAAGLLDLLGFLAWGLGWVGPLALWPAVRSRRVVAVVLVTLVLAAGVTWSGGDWMPGFRRLGPVLLVVAVLAGASVGLARGPARWSAAAGAIGLAGAQVWAGVQGVGAGAFPVASMVQLGVAAASTPGVRVVALSDIGAFGWHFPGRIVDLVGLVDAEVAARPGRHLRKPWSEATFLAQQVDLAVVISTTDPRATGPRQLRVHASEVGLVMTAQRAGWRLHGALPLTSGQYAVVLVRPGLALPEDPWGPPFTAALSAYTVDSFDVPVESLLGLPPASATLPR